MSSAQTKWWLPIAILAFAGIFEIAGALYVGSMTWIVFGLMWMAIAAIHGVRSRPT